MNEPTPGSGDDRPSDRINPTIAPPGSQPVQGFHIGENVYVLDRYPPRSVWGYKRVERDSGFFHCYSRRLDDGRCAALVIDEGTHPHLMISAGRYPEELDDVLTGDWFLDVDSNDHQAAIIAANAMIRWLVVTRMAKPFPDAPYRPPFISATPA